MLRPSKFCKNTSQEKRPKNTGFNRFIWGEVNPVKSLNQQSASSIRNSDTNFGFEIFENMGSGNLNREKFENGDRCGSQVYVWNFNLLDEFWVGLAALAIWRRAKWTCSREAKNPALPLRVWLWLLRICWFWTNRQTIWTSRLSPHWRMRLDSKRQKIFIKISGIIVAQNSSQKIPLYYIT